MFFDVVVTGNLVLRPAQLRGCLVVSHREFELRPRTDDTQGDLQNDAQRAFEQTSQ